MIYTGFIGRLYDMYFSWGISNDLLLLSDIPAGSVPVPGTIPFNVYTSEAIYNIFKNRLKEIGTSGIADPIHQSRPAFDLMKDRLVYIFLNNKNW